MGKKKGGNANHHKGEKLKIREPRGGPRNTEDLQRHVDDKHVLAHALGLLMVKDPWTGRVEATPPTESYYAESREKTDQWHDNPTGPRVSQAQAIMEYPEEYRQYQEAQERARVAAKPAGNLALVPNVQVEPSALSPAA
jgi:hypothetical protein